MNAAHLSAELKLGPSELWTADLARLRHFYVYGVGLEVLAESPGRVLLGQGDKEILALIESTDRPPDDPRAAGLFQHAILFDFPAALAQTARVLLQDFPQAFSGTGDHWVSKAFYFTDSDGNSLELYADRPRESWTWRDGEVRMGTEYIDPAAFIAAHAGETLNLDKKLGHVHLRVGDLEQARRFYVETLGFEVTASLLGVLFVSVGHYHHHLGLNVWQSRGAGMRTASLGLGAITIRLPKPADLDRLAARLKNAEVSFEAADGRIAVADPWGISFRFLIL